MPVKVINTEFELKQEVWLKTDPEQLKRIVIGFMIFVEGEIMYRLMCGTLQSDHWAFEISAEKDPITIIQG